MEVVIICFVGLLGDVGTNCKSNTGYARAILTKNVLLVVGNVWAMQANTSPNVCTSVPHDVGLAELHSNFRSCIMTLVAIYHHV